MKESSTYQAILAEGRVEGRAQGAVAEARRLLRLFGDRQLGDPDARTAAAIEAIDDLAQLEGFCDQLPAAAGWRDLLDLPQPRSRKRRPSP